MSAIAALVAGVADGRAHGGDHGVAAMMAAMRSRGEEAPELATIPGPPPAALGVIRMPWERAVTVHGGGRAERGPLTVVADATLYYADDLRRACAAAGSVPASLSAADLILAAYSAFGEQCTHRIEGDFAFIIWDATRGRLFAARDFSGKRTLFYASVGGSLAVASTAGGVLAAPGAERVVDLATLVSVASGSWTHTDETAWRGVRELRAGHALVHDAERGTRTVESWVAPAEILRTRQPLDDAAMELRELLVRATEERMSPSGPTSVSLSGGWDSTAIYAAGQHALARGGTAGRTLAPVSISYPEGDPGREDEIISDIVAHWRGRTRFIPVDGIPLFDDAAGRAAHREHPMAHTYEEWNRALSRGARAEGARVMLDGLGGDQLFQVSDIFLSDLFRRGRWIELARQYRARADGRGDLRSLWRWGIGPALPAPLRNLIARLRRAGPPRHYLERGVPFWFRAEFLAQHGIAERERLHRPALPAHDAVLAEGHAFLRFAFYPRIIGMLHSFALEEGVELRSPLLDERIVRFAMRRPWSERSDGRETKILLRRAMKGLLPDQVLAPRSHRTGVTSAYFLRQLRGPARPLVEGTFFLADSRLASMGMIDARLLRRAWDHLLAHDDDELGGRIFFTLQAELWLRGQEGA